MCHEDDDGVVGNGLEELTSPDALLQAETTSRVLVDEDGVGEEAAGLAR